MVHPGQPERAVPAHPLVSRHHVHECVLQSMAHVKRARDVRRRNDNSEHRRFRIVIYLGRKIPIPLPPFVVVLLSFLRVVLFGDLHA